MYAALVCIGMYCIRMVWGGMIRCDIARYGTVRRGIVYCRKGWRSMGSFDFEECSATYIYIYVYIYISQILSVLKVSMLLFSQNQSLPQSVSSSGIFSSCHML